MDTQLLSLLSDLRAERITDLQLGSNSGRLSVRRGGLYSRHEQTVDTKALSDALFSGLDNNSRLLFDHSGSVTVRLAHERFGVVRVHLFKAMGATHAAIRFLDDEPWMLEDLKLPPGVGRFADMGSGLVLFTGLPGAGKTTTQAAVLRRLYERHPGQHISTIDNPLEFIHDPAPDSGTIVTQREVGPRKDAPTFGTALRSVLRSDSVVIALGELFDDDETIPAAIEAAAAGLLVFATIHAPSLGDALERIINAFPPEREQMLRTLLARSFAGGVCLRLVPGDTEGQVEPACELLFKSTAAENHILNGTVGYLWDVEDTEHEMQTLESDLNRLLTSGRISRGEALRAAVRKNEIV